MSDEQQAELPGLPAGHPANAGPIHGTDNLVNAPPIDWAKPQPMSVEQAAQTQARNVAGKGKAAQDKDAVGANEQAPTVAKPASKRAAKVTATADQGQPRAAKAPRTRKKAAPVAAVPTPGQPAAGTERDARQIDLMGKLAASGQAAATGGGTPAAGSAPAADDAIPPITAEAITFLGNPSATAADVLKLGADSLTFVQHHFNFMRRLEPDSQANKAYLMANTFAGALLKSRSNLTPDKEPVAATMPAPEKQQPAPALGASYGPKAGAVAAFAPVAVQLGKLEIVPGKADGQEQTPEAVLEDTRRAHKVMGTAGILMSAPINDLTAQEAAELVAGDIEEVRAIKDVKARQLALNAIAESSVAQPRYKAEFERQAPDLMPAAAEARHAMDVDWDKAYGVSRGLSRAAEVDTPLTREKAANGAGSDIEAIRGINSDEVRQHALSDSFQTAGLQPLYKEEFARKAPDLVEPARAAYEAVRAQEAQWAKEEQEPENSIERSPVQLVSNEQEAAQPAAPAAKVASAAQRRRSLGKRLLLVAGGAAQKAGTWLLDRGKEGHVPAASATPVSLAKPAAPAKPTAPTAAPAIDKSNIVPEAVARRFLKVEREYYFPDRTPAFSDRGQKLATRGADPDVVRSMVEIAKARGWDTITVKGTGDFPRSAWMEASHNGLKVVGYQPTSLDLAELANRPANNTVEKGAVKEKGPAPVQQQAAAKAAEASPDQPTVALQGAPAQAADASKPDPELAKKAKAFENNKPGFVVKKYPDLVGAYGIVEAAKTFAAEKLPEASREEFVGMARHHVMQKIMAGEPVKGPKIYLAPVKTLAASDQTKAPAQQVADLGKSPRVKGVARER